MTDVFAPQSDSDSRKFVKRFQSDGTAVFEQVGFTDLDFTKIFGQTTNSGTANTIEYGIKGFTLDIDDGSIQVGYPLQCRSWDDQDCFMQGVVVTKDTTYFPAYIEVAITIISAITNTSYNWELSVIPLAGFSINPSATVGISTTSIDASGDGPFTFTTQTGKLFMQPTALGGTVVCTALEDPKTYLFARIVANDSGSLVVNKIYSNATVAVSAWSIQMFDGPDGGIGPDEIFGLVVTGVHGETTIDISAGSVRDSTDTVDLVLSASLTKDLTATFATGDGNGSQVVSGNLPGTVTITSNVVVGTGTAFLTDLVSGVVGWFTTINVSGDSTMMDSITTDTDATTLSITDKTGQTYFRGGYYAADSAYYYACIARRDSDGACDIIAAQGTSDGTPDLPSGYTFYRKLALLKLVSGTHFIVPLNYLDSAGAAGVWLQTETTDAFPNGKVLIGSTTIALDDTILTGYTKIVRRALTGDVTAPYESSTTTIAANAVTNTKLNDMAAYTLKGRNAGTTGDPSDIDITALTEQASPTTTDYLIGVDTAASNAFKKYKASNFGSGGTSFPADMGLITDAVTTTFDCGTVP